MILPRATLLNEASMTSAGPSPRGTAKAIGLVPKTPRDPPHGAMAAGELEKASPTSPWSASHST
jgi:hypothetical protein